MNTFALFALLCVAVAAVSARPGGYTTNGGVYAFDPNRELDYMDQARQAGKFAWSKKFEEEVGSEDVNRNERNTGAYVPTFFTSHQNHAALTASRPALQAAEPAPVRAQRETPAAEYNAPLYYRQ